MQDILDDDGLDVDLEKVIPLFLTAFVYRKGSN